jgi:hypothetical protein
MDPELRQILHAQAEATNKTNQLLEDTKAQNAQLLKLALAQVELLTKSLSKEKIAYLIVSTVHFS